MHARRDSRILICRNVLVEKVIIFSLLLVFSFRCKIRVCVYLFVALIIDNIVSVGILTWRSDFVVWRKIMLLYVNYFHGVEFSSWVFLPKVDFWWVFSWDSWDSGKILCWKCCQHKWSGCSEQSASLWSRDVRLFLICILSLSSLSWFWSLVWTCRIHHHIYIFLAVIVVHNITKTHTFICHFQLLSSSNDFFAYFQVLSSTFTCMCCLHWATCMERGERLNGVMSLFLPKHSWE